MNISPEVLSSSFVFALGYTFATVIINSFSYEEKKESVVSAFVVSFIVILVAKLIFKF